ncbi:MAG: sulfotransferase domain-containing protein [Chloroflexi bacterium]|nr:sulfotransferase domain-containing protein [Chloroflexota bacterium]
MSDKPIYIVSGLPRSGTSMMMKMLEAGGLSVLTDNIRTADDDNLQGYYELERVKAMKEGDTTWVEEANGKVVKVISALLEHLPANYQYKIIFMDLDKVKTWLVGRSNMDVLYVRYNEMIAHPADYAAKVAEFLDIPMDVGTMEKVPQEQYYRQRK